MYYASNIIPETECLFMDSSNLIIGISVWFGDYPVFFYFNY